MEQNTCRRIADAVGDTRGNIATITAILLVPLIAVLAMGVEVAGWYTVQRGAQNTADTSAIAVATQGANTNDTLAQLNTYGQSVASKYGFPYQRRGQQHDSRGQLSG